MKKKTLGNFPFLNIVFSISTALFLMSVFMYLLFLANVVQKELGKGYEVRIFLYQKINQQQISDLVDQINQLPFVIPYENNEHVAYKSRSELTNEVIKQTGEDFMTLLESNPLRDALIFYVEKEMREEELKKEIRSLFSSKPGVYDISFPPNFLEGVNNNLRKIAFFFMGLVILLLLVIVILINNAIKLAFFSQRFLIRSMQLVGATPGFIMKPFLLRSLVIGLSAGAVAFWVFFVFLLLSKSQIIELNEVVDSMYLILEGLVVTCVGGLIAVVSTYLAVNRYLKMQLDDLY